LNAQRTADQPEVAIRRTEEGRPFPGVLEGDREFQFAFVLLNAETMPPARPRASPSGTI
jgi:hypothetical protein